MSMLQAQCDELRAMAESVGLAMPQAATLMMEAADTIWELRCKLADMVDMRERARVAESENAKLWEELAKARDPQRIGGQADPSSFVYAIEQLREFRWQHATNDEDVIPYINNVVAAHERENAKLRELCGELWNGYMDPPCEECPLKGLPACADCPICAREAAVVARMRELGIEVGE